MRFDLTVPLARFAAQHIGELGTPFKRYHIATVWRGENTQRGRYREFMQCDFDTIGTRSLAADIETALVIHDLLRAIGFDDFTIRVNNRMVLTGLLERLGLADRADGRAAGARQARQDRPREGGRRDDRRRRRRRPSRPTMCCDWPRSTATNDEMLRQLEPLVAGSETGQAGVGKLARAAGGRGGRRRADERVRLDVSIARGLDYYTGTIFETFLGRPAGHRQRLLAAAATTTWPGCSPSRNCRASAPRWGSIGCWRRWKSWA